MDIHTSTETKYGAATNFDGRYNLLNVRVGRPYTITISYIGYKDHVLIDLIYIPTTSEVGHMQFGMHYIF